MLQLVVAAEVQWAVLYQVPFRLILKHVTTGAQWGRISARSSTALTGLSHQLVEDWRGRRSADRKPWLFAANFGNYLGRQMIQLPAWM